MIGCLCSYVFYMRSDGREEEECRTKIIQRTDLFHFISYLDPLRIIPAQPARTIKSNLAQRACIYLLYILCVSLFVQDTTPMTKFIPRIIDWESP